MTTILLILIGVLLLIVLMGVFVIVAAFWLIHRLEKFLKGHKTVTGTLATVTTLVGFIPSVVSLLKAIPWSTRTK